MFIMVEKIDDYLVLEKDFSFINFSLLKFNKAPTKREKIDKFDRIDCIIKLNIHILHDLACISGYTYKNILSSSIHNNKNKQTKNKPRNVPDTHWQVNGWTVWYIQTVGYYTTMKTELQLHAA